ncbi:MAG: DNA ligase D [Armatimonadetes bacterium]|nr:DNA ligase D [Armatimonadota bacterium]
MALEDYQKKRRFSDTTEPKGEEAGRVGHRFVVHEHHASRLHFDLRIEMDNVLKSWAVPKGPSMDPSYKRLAVMVEDHPLEYLTFRGEIAEGNYGAGLVEIWDSGSCELIEGDIAQGKLVLDLAGTKLRGRFDLVRLKKSGNDWLLIKTRDEFAEAGWNLEQMLPGGSRKDIIQRRTTTAEQAENPDPMPRKISPMLATPVSKPFSDPEWLFEPKYDGYRVLSFIEENAFRFVSRTGQDMIEQVPQASSIPGLVEARTAILDGELIALDRDGKPSFQLLQNTIKTTSPAAQLIYYVFDLLYLNGSDFRQRPLIERKELLRSIIRADGFLRYCDHVVEMGERLFEEAGKAGIEGIIAKRMNSPYVEKRSKNWLKIKAVHRQEVVIAGYTQPRGAREHFGALLIGTYDKETLRFAGHVGSGFDDATLKELADLMQPLRIDSCPFAKEPKTNEPAVWIKPELVCEVKYAQWTDEGILRQPVFLGLRTDKPPREVVREKPEEAADLIEHRRPIAVDSRIISADEAFERPGLEGDLLVSIDGAEVPLTNLRKVYWPKEGFTKADLLRYYYRVREIILPHLADRPLILQRFPDGIEGESFYQHNLQDAPDFVRRVPVTENGSVINYAVIDNVASLLYIANLGCIAQHPFSSRVETLDRPDWIVLDLDPEEAPFDTVCEVAMEVKGTLDEIGLSGYPKTSGSRGMHVYMPIEGVYTYDQAQEFAKILASVIAIRKPNVATIERAKKERTAAQVYVDYLQNAPGKSIASPYSVRAEPGATVSTPLTWEEVASKPDKEQYTLLTVQERFAQGGDVFGNVLTQKQRLAQPLERLEILLTAVK